MTTLVKRLMCGTCIKKGKDHLIGKSNYVIKSFIIAYKNSENTICLAFGPFKDDPFLKMVKHTL